MEQGFGDMVQFCRYADLLAAQGALVLLEAPGELIELMRTLESRPRLLTHGADPPQIDFHCPLLLPFHPDWRRMLERRDSPWYPSLTLYRQPSPGDWDGVLK